MHFFQFDRIIGENIIGAPKLCKQIFSALSISLFGSRAVDGKRFSESNAFYILLTLT